MMRSLAADAARWLFIAAPLYLLWALAAAAAALALCAFAGVRPANLARGAWRHLRRQSRPAGWFLAPAAVDDDPEIERRAKVADTAGAVAALVRVLPRDYAADVLVQAAYLLNVTTTTELWGEKEEND